LNQNGTIKNDSSSAKGEGININIDNGQINIQNAKINEYKSVEFPSKDLSPHLNLRLNNKIKGKRKILGANLRKSGLTSDVIASIGTPDTVSIKETSST